MKKEQRLTLVGNSDEVNEAFERCKKFIFKHPERITYFRHGFFRFTDNDDKDEDAIYNSGRFKDNKQIFEDLFNQVSKRIESGNIKRFYFSVQIEYGDYEI